MTVGRRWHGRHIIRTSNLRTKSKKTKQKDNINDTDNPEELIRPSLIIARNGRNCLAISFLSCEKRRSRYEL